MRPRGEIGMRNRFSHERKSRDAPESQGSNGDGLRESVVDLRQGRSCR